MENLIFEFFSILANADKLRPKIAYFYNNAISRKS